MKAFILVLLIMVVAVRVSAQISFRSQLNKIPESTVANLPATPASGVVRIVTDGDSETDCTAGGGSSRVLCEYTGSAWAALGDGGSVSLVTGSDGDSTTTSSDSCMEFIGGALTLIRGCDDGQVCKWFEASDDWQCADDADSASTTLDAAFDLGKVIDGATSLELAARIGGATSGAQWCFYHDGSTLIATDCDQAAGTQTRINTNTTWTIYDVEGAATAFTFDPDAVTANGMTTWASGYRPVKSIYWPAGALSSDGTQCANPAEVTINSGLKTYTIICTENDAGRMHGSVKMPDSWDAGTVTFEVLYVQTAADTGSVALEVAAACRGIGETMNGTYGTEVEVDDAALVGSSAIESTTSGVVTPDGTCASGDFLYFYVDIDATDNPTTAAATLNFVGVKLEYTVDSMSD